MMPITVTRKSMTLGEGGTALAFRGSGGVFDLRCGARIYCRICLSRVARRRRQRCDGVRDGRTATPSVPLNCRR